MSGFEYKTNLTAVVDALKDANTTTANAYLSQSLTSAIDSDNIINGNPETYQIVGTRLPAIFIRIPNAQEEFMGIGPTGTNRNKKEKTINYQIIGMYPRPLAYQKESDALEEIYNLARNIEAVFQENYRLSNTAMWCAPTETNFDGPFQLEDNTMLKTVVIDLQAKYQFR